MTKDKTKKKKKNKRGESDKVCIGKENKYWKTNFTAGWGKLMTEFPFYN